MVVKRKCDFFFCKAADNETFWGASHRKEGVGGVITGVAGAKGRRGEPERPKVAWWLVVGTGWLLLGKEVSWR